MKQLSLKEYGGVACLVLLCLGLYNIPESVEGELPATVISVNSEGTQGKVQLYNGDKYTMKFKPKTIHNVGDKLLVKKVSYIIKPTAIKEVD